MTGRYFVQRSKRKVHGCDLYEVIDTQDGRCVADSIFESQCIFKARQLNVKHERERERPK